MNSTENKSDWSISDLYSKAWQAVKNNKILWLFGTAVLTFSSDSFFNLSSKFDDKTLNKIQGIFQPSQGLSLGQVLSDIPWYFYLILTLELLFVIAIAIVISLISKAWANGALIHASQASLDAQKVTIRDASEKSFPSIKALIFLDIVPNLVFWLVAVIVFIILIAGLTAGSLAVKIIFGILMAAFFIFFIYALIMLVITQIWAYRLAVLDRKGGAVAFLSGYVIAKKKFWASLLLGIVNTLVSFLVLLIPMALIVGLIFGGVVGLILNKDLVITLIIIGVILFISIITAYSLLLGILTAFKSTAWTAAYHNIRGKYDRG